MVPGYLMAQNFVMSVHLFTRDNELMPYFKCSALNLPLLFVISIQAYAL